MNILEFMSSSPYLTFFIVYVLAELIFRCWNRMIRCINISKNGWPPAHCDADGDLMEDE